MLNIPPFSPLLPTPPADWQTLFHQLTGKLADLCPLCQKGRVVRVEQLTSALPQLSRSPPARQAAIEVYADLLTLETIAFRQSHPRILVHDAAKLGSRPVKN